MLSVHWISPKNSLSYVLKDFFRRQTTSDESGFSAKLVTFSIKLEIENRPKTSQISILFCQLIILIE